MLIQKCLVLEEKKEEKIYLNKLPLTFKWFLFKGGIYINSKYIIKKNDEFEYILNNGICVKNKYFVIYNIERKLENNRYGISVSKKIGHAVVRNKIKRRIKDIISKNSIKSGYDYVIIVRKAINDLSYSDMKSELLKLIKGE